VKERGLAQQSDAGAIMELIERAITDNPKMVTDYRKNPNALNALVGQVMKASRGTANNQVVRESLIQRLATPE